METIVFSSDDGRRTMLCRFIDNIVLENRLRQISLYSEHPKGFSELLNVLNSDKESILIYDMFGRTEWRKEIMEIYLKCKGTAVLIVSDYFGAGDKILQLPIAYGNFLLDMETHLIRGLRKS